MLEPVKLSLATFQPDKCYPPYLNTPRSLEACRMNGVNPLELVELPFSEFQRDFPNDLDAAKRRYERIDGARRRTLEKVKTDWKRLIDSNWKPPLHTRPLSAKETILPVPPQAHCTLLEIQASKFRKIERENWEDLQRRLKIEIVKADQEVQNKKILQKHDNLQEKRENYFQERRIALQELHREVLMQRIEAEEEEMEEIKIEQQEFQKEIIAKSQQSKEEMKRQKIAREQREYERVQRMKYTLQVKDSIMNGIEEKYENRKKMSELRAKNNEERIKDFLDRRSREREEKLKDLDLKIDHVKAERERIAAENRKATLDKIMEHERHRREVEEARIRYKTEVLPQDQDKSYEKMMKIREKNANLIKAKADRTLSALQHKEDLARREMEKIQEAQERRKAIKAIRQEAHEIALFRAQKAEEYRLAKVKESIKNKEDRTMAIRQGFQILDHMRNTMKDIMVKTNAELKNEMDRLRHIDDFSPDKVAVKAMEVSNHVLFPKLQAKFGIETHEDDPMKKLYATTGGMNDTDRFGFNIGTSAQPLSEMDTNPLYEGDRTALTEEPNKKAGTGGKKTRALSASRSHSRGRANNPKAHSLSPGREMTTLHIQALTQDNLKNSLLQSIKRVEGLRTTQSMTSMKTLSPSKPRAMTTSGMNSADEEYETGYPTPILKLKNEDGTWEEDDQRSKASSSFGKQSSITKGTGIDTEDSKARGRSRRSFRGDNPNRRDSNAVGTGENNSVSSSKQFSRQDDGNNANDIPIFEFTAGEEFKNHGEDKKQKRNRKNLPKSGNDDDESTGDNNNDNNNNNNEGEEQTSPSASPDGALGDSHNTRRRRRGNGRNDTIPKGNAKNLSKQETLRTDKNEKAKYLKLPPGKFRREFSLDHPLAPNGKGKYTKELQQGLKPIGLFVNPIKRANEDIEETIALAEKMDKLTYEATTTFLDKTKTNEDEKTINESLEDLKKQLNHKLEDLLEEERLAEEDRMEAIRNIKDPQEKYNLEIIFAEERQRASEKIIQITKENDQMMKQALLKTMNLGNYLQTAV